MPAADIRNNARRPWSTVRAPLRGERKAMRMSFEILLTAMHMSATPVLGTLRSYETLFQVLL
jgi:hypothetical protein